MQLIRSDSTNLRPNAAPLPQWSNVLLTAGSYRPDEQHVEILLPSYGNYDYRYRLSRQETEYLISRLQGHIQSMEREDQKVNENQHAKRQIS